MAQKFFNRVRELASLEEHYKHACNGSGSFVVLYGRRRVGKTELVRRFIESIDSTRLYFYVDLAERRVILDALQKSILEQLKETVVFSDFDDFFAFVKNKADHGPFVLVIDEFQRFLTVAPEVITSLQRYWDNEFKNRKMMLIIVGSSIGMIQKITGSRAGALYGRADRIRVGPFRYRDFRLMFSNLDETEKIVRYAVFGGTPYYLEKTLAYDDTSSAINDLVIKKDGSLSEEPKNLMEYENFRTHARYNSILQSISSGKEVLKEIADFTKVPITALPPYLTKLDELLSLIEKKDPVLGKERLKRYKISDNFFRFWYKFVFENQTTINLENRTFVKDKIKAELNSYVGRLFEDVVRELLIAYQGKKLKGIEVNFEEIGSWWDRNGNEIDLVSVNTKEKRILTGEVKWSSHPIGEDVLDGLIRKSKLIGAPGRYEYMLVSKAGFTETCKKKAQELGATALDIGDIKDLFDDITEEAPR
jgi:AAA+ ATPase superfamily predicted ATPase